MAVITYNSTPFVSCLNICEKFRIPRHINGVQEIAAAVNEFVMEHSVQDIADAFRGLTRADLLMLRQLNISKTVRKFVNGERRILEIPSIPFHDPIALPWIKFFDHFDQYEHLSLAINEALNGKGSEALDEFSDQELKQMLTLANLKAYVEKLIKSTLQIRNVASLDEPLQSTNKSCRPFFFATDLYDDLLKKFNLEQDLSEAINLLFQRKSQDELMAILQNLNPWHLTQITGLAGINSSILEIVELEMLKRDEERALWGKLLSLFGIDRIAELVPKINTLAKEDIDTLQERFNQLDLQELKQILEFPNIGDRAAFRIMCIQTAKRTESLEQTHKKLLKAVANSNKRLEEAEENRKAFEDMGSLIAQQNESLQETNASLDRIEKLVADAKEFIESEGLIAMRSLPEDLRSQIHNGTGILKKYVPIIEKPVEAPIPSPQETTKTNQLSRIGQIWSKFVALVRTIVCVAIPICAVVLAGVWIYRATPARHYYSNSGLSNSGFSGS